MQALHLFLSLLGRVEAGLGFARPGAGCVDGGLVGFGVRGDGLLEGGDMLAHVGQAGPKVGQPGPALLRGQSLRLGVELDQNLSFADLETDGEEASRATRPVMRGTTGWGRLATSRRAKPTVTS